MRIFLLDELGTREGKDLLKLILNRCHVVRTLFSIGATTGIASGFWGVDSHARSWFRGSRARGLQKASTKLEP